MATETNLEKELFDLENQFWQAMKDGWSASYDRLDAYLRTITQ